MGTSCTHTVAHCPKVPNIPHEPQEKTQRLSKLHTAMYKHRCRLACKTVLLRLHGR
jgi:hypothetical protein